MSAFSVVQIFLSCVHATLFVVQLPWKGSGTTKNFTFALIHLCIAAALSNSPVFYVSAAANLAAISISAGGIRLRRGTTASCDCFGVLNDELGKRSHTIGVAIIAAHLLALALSAVMSRAGAERLPIVSPQVCGGVLSFLIALVGVRTHRTKAPPGARAAFNPNEPVRIAVPADMVLGRDQRDTPRTLASIHPANGSFGFLIATEGCQPCALLKRDIATLRDVVQIPLCLINGSPGPALEPHSLHDHDKTLRQLAGVAATPCLLVLDAGAGVVTRKVYGLESIRAALLELIATNRPLPHFTESVS